ncbi:succinate dehydrogenase, cytochrome b556 subunit [Kangiella sediminilitoris]|uniref:Succinate dehydrogenase cytochrome b556 subunit n=1 Tax=Kangiella sediminilitoris TaxID=1144748 RepID=A0A1B3BA90_9GAMM|nr:succinate dehydrogenase, cytochrome b556 subunit [Kangiella sediminilitoris]AOE49664.1 Succinate dehydrogenase, cytochrome b556 subunit [Kangiella sediminilitoris]
MIKKRPKNLDLTTVSFPVPAISSILHRITGVVLFIAVPILLWMLQKSLDSAGYAELQAMFSESIVWQFILWAILTSVAYHVIAGVRHLLMDLGIGETLEGGRRGAWAVLLLSVISAVLLGVWVW